MTTMAGLRLIAMVAMIVAARPVVASGPTCAGGEPDFSAGQAYHYDGVVSLHPDGGTIAADWMRAISTGCAELTESGARVVNTQPQLDIAVTMLSAARSQTGPGYQVFDTRSGARDMSGLVQAAEFCVAYLNERFGERERLPTATIVVHDRSEAGYARGTLIALTDVPDLVDDEALMFICHEFAHFWSINGNPGSIENWLNESFAEYAGVRALSEARGEAAAEAMLEEVAGAEHRAWFQARLAE